MAAKLFFKLMNEQSGSDLMSFAKEVLGNHCSPIYGAEQKDLESILKSDDLRCEVLLSTVEPSSSPGTQPSSPVPLGLVVYKIKPTDEFARFGVTNSLEIKTLCLADPSKSRGKGYRSFLLSQAVNFARSISSSSVHVTVSDTKRDLYTFFLDKGFKEQAAMSNNLLGGEAPEKLYVLRLSAGDKDRAQKRASADSGGFRELTRYLITLLLSVTTTQSQTRLHQVILSRENAYEKIQVYFATLEMSCICNYSVTVQRSRRVHLVIQFHKSDPE